MRAQTLTLSRTAGLQREGNHSGAPGRQRHQLWWLFRVTQGVTYSKAGSRVYEKSLTVYAASLMHML